MEIRKNIMTRMLFVVAFALMTAFCLTPYATAENLEFERVKLLQTIESQLSQANGMKPVAVHVFTEQRRKIHVTPSSIGLSYGFLKDMQTINQLVATLAHLTAYISLGYVVTPPLPEDIKRETEKTSLSNFLKSFVRPQYPDKSYMPEANGTFQEDRSEAITRPSYQNREYDYSVNKANILTTERQLEVDKATNKIMIRAGFCPQDYSRLLHYFYETPQTIPENKHFTLDAEQWQRIDTADQRADPATPCSKAQSAQVQKYAEGFERFKIKVLQALNADRTN